MSLAQRNKIRAPLRQRGSKAMEKDDRCAVWMNGISCSNVGIASLPATPDPITLGTQMAVPGMEHRKTGETAIEISGSQHRGGSKVKLLHLEESITAVCQCGVGKV